MASYRSGDDSASRQIKGELNARMRELPAMSKWQCRMHGGTSPGAPKGNRNAWKHGGRSAETARTLALIRDLGRLLDEAEELSIG